MFLSEIFYYFSPAFFVPLFVLLTTKVMSVSVAVYFVSSTILLSLLLPCFCFFPFVN
jgi:hypothetical protein